MQNWQDIEVRGFYEEYPDTAGLFSSIGHAFKSVGKAIGKPLAAISKVVTAPITVPTKFIGKAVSHVPVLGTIVNAANQIALSPINVTQAVLEGGRIDRVMLDNLKQTLASVKTLGPYVQTVLSMVPGIGTGVSAAIGAGLALAEGKSITDAMLAGVKGAIPGGPLAQSAFSVAQAAIQRKPIDQIAIAALPISDQQKQLLTQGMNAVKDIAAGKNVAHSIVDNAIKALPPEYAKAVQIGMAMGHAKSLQDALKTGATAAATTLLPTVTKALPPSVINIANNVAKGLPLSPASVAELAKHKITPAAVLAMAKGNLPTKIIGVANPMMSPFFKRANSIPVINLGRQITRLSSVPSATNSVVRAIQRNPALLAQQTQAIANVMRTNAASVKDAVNVIAQKRNLLPWRSLNSTTVAFLRRHVPNAPMMALRHGHTNIGGLDSTGTTYIVEKGDSPWAITQKLTGNGNRWKELLPYNKDKKPTLDKNVWVGEVINLPPAWQKPKPAALPAPTPALPSLPVPSPSIAPKPDIIQQATEAANAIIPGILQAKTILVAWGKTDGINQAGVSDYGQQAADLSTTMGPRDTLQLQSFQNWDNKTLNDGLNVSGNLDAKTLQALQSWAAARAAQGSAPSPVPVVRPTGFDPSTDVTPTVIPTVVGGTASSPVPPVAPAPPKTTLPTQATPNSPATGGSGALIAGGAIAGGLLFGVPGAIVGGIAGAALT